MICVHCKEWRNEKRLHDCSVVGAHEDHFSECALIMGYVELYCTCDDNSPEI